MAIMNPFRALRPRPEHAQAVASVPYDVINTAEARALAGDNPHSFLRVIRSEIEFGGDVDPYSDAVYQRAAENLAKLVDGGVLTRDAGPALFIYRIEMGDHVQTGLFGAASLDEYENGLIKKHENTRPQKEDDRTRHMLALGVQPGPVILTYRAVPELSTRFDAECRGEALYDVNTETGVRHRIWRAEDAAGLSAAFEAVPCMYVADGHHRIASAARCRAQLREKNPRHSGEEPYNFVLAAVFPDDALRILPYNRIIKRLPLSAEALLEGLARAFEVVQDAGPVPERKGRFHLYLGGSWYGLLPKTGETLPDDPVEALDVRILHRKALEPLLGIGDERTDTNIDFVGGIRGTDELERLVDGGDAACAFSMFATSISELLDVADRNVIMAPKSTWFEPKLRSGLLIHPLDA